MVSSAPSPSKKVGWVLAAIWSLLTLNLLLCVARFQPNVLAWDQWDFYAPLFKGADWKTLFTYQHGPHRQGLGFVLTSWILELTHWDARADSLWIGGLISAATALALRLKWKLTGMLQLKDAWIPVVGLSLSQFEALLLVPNASHSAFPLAVTMLAANLWLVRQTAVRYMGGALCAVALTFTGFGLFAGAIVTVLLGAAAGRDCFRRQWKSFCLALGGFALATLGWIWFGSNYVFAPAVAGFRFPWTPVREYLQFILLMLVETTGVEGASWSHYAAGGVLAVLISIAAVVVLWKWIRGRQASPEDEVLLLLLGAGALFVCNTAVGRVCLGVEAAMSSRYVTLMFPLWLGVYVFSIRGRGRAYKFVATVAMWCIALWPFADMRSRPLNQWAGTIGATNGQYGAFEQFTYNKAAWVDTYLKTRSWEAAQEVRGPAIYPAPADTKIGDKLKWLESRHLSFFAERKSFLPYLLNNRTVWNDEFPSTGQVHVIEEKTRLTFITQRDGFAEVTLRASQPVQGNAAKVEIDHAGKTQTVALAQLPVVISVPVSPGFNELVFRRSAESGGPELTASPATYRATDGQKR